MRIGTVSIQGTGRTKDDWLWFWHCSICGLMSRDRRDKATVEAWAEAHKRTHLNT